MKSTQSHFTPCPTTLRADELSQYWRDGYLAFTDVLTPCEVEEARAALSDLAHQVVSNPQRERKGTFWTLPNSRFGIQFESGYTPDEADADLELKIRKFMWYCDEHALFQFFAREHPRIQGVMSSILGANPILFQDMALVKPPFIGSEKPWHQDDAYFAVTPIDRICGVWIALDEASVANGCMHVLPGGQLQGPQKHFHDRDCEIMTDRLENAGANARAVAVPLPPGGALFFSGLLPHQTPPNQSPERRRALQLHYRGADTISVSREEYDRVFAKLTALRLHARQRECFLH